LRSSWGGDDREGESLQPSCADGSEDNSALAPVLRNVVAVLRYDAAVRGELPHGQRE